MKHTDRALAFVTGAIVAVVAMFAIENWKSKPSVDYATSKDVEEVRARVAGLHQTLRESEKLIRAEIEKNRFASERRAAEEAARRDVAVVRAAQDAARRAEEEARKQAELVKMREVAAASAREKAQMAAAEARAGQDARRKAMSRSERERIADEEAARKALAAARPTSTEIETLYQQAMAMESEGNARDAVRIYRRAARGGSGKAARRLGDIFNCGAPGVPRDYAESLQWYETARQLGEDIPTTGGAKTPARSRLSDRYLARRRRRPVSPLR